jgi:serine/threonine protein kinase/tetratricopeptide (TPR) repeat protein
MNERSIFMEALDFDDPGQRLSYVDRACGGDERLRARVKALLGRHQANDQLVLDRMPTVDHSPMEDVALPVEEPGTSIGPYKLREQIGEGGMGVVYVAEQTQPVRRRVALKIIKPGMDSRQVIARFEAERQALAMMDHPNIARVFDGGTTPSGRPYFVMELVRGIPITDYCDRERLSIPERLNLFVQVCRAVQHAHQKGIIHRDLKPSNILVTIIDGVAVPKVIDFGVAKATGASLTERTVYTAFHQFVGTPLYMSPEQADLSGMDVDTRSDIYSLGVLLYELLTGTTPFDQDTFRTAAFDEVRRIIREQEPPKPSTRLSSLGATRATVSANRQADSSQLNRAVRGELDWIVMKALEKDRRRRYETANDFASDIHRYLSDQPVEAGPPSAWYRFGKLARRNRVALVSAGLVALALIVSTAVSTWQALVAARARRETSQALAVARAEADKASAINEFLINDLLVQADPEQNPVAEQTTLRQVVDRAAEKAGTRFRGRPLLEAALRITLGDTYHGLGAWTESRKQAAAALAIYEREQGPMAEETLKAVGQLGHASYHEGKNDEAEPLLLRSLEGLIRVLGERNPETLDVMHNLASVYRSQGKPAEAEPLFVKVLELGRQTQGEEHSITLGAMNGLAVLYAEQCELAQAEQLLVKVLEIRRRVLGREHPSTRLAMHNLSAVYVRQGQLARAERLKIELLEGTRRLKGGEHDASLNSVRSLAKLYIMQGRLTEAEPLLVKTLEVRRRRLGEEGPETLLDAASLAHLYSLNGKHDRSIPWLEDLLKLIRGKFGPGDPNTLETMRILGDSYRDSGRLSEAAGILEEARAMALNQPGLPVVVLDSIPIALGETYEQAGQFARAESLYRESLEIGRQRNKGAGLSTDQQVSLAVSLARSLLKQRRCTEAEPMLRECLKFREHYGPDDWSTFNTKSLLGASLLGQKRYAEAEPLLLAGCDGMKQLEGMIPPVSKLRLAEAIERLVHLYEAWGKSGQVAAWRAKLGLGDLPVDVFVRP